MPDSGVVREMCCTLARLNMTWQCFSRSHHHWRRETWVFALRTSVHPHSPNHDSGERCRGALVVHSLEGDASAEEEERRSSLLGFTLGHLRSFEWSVFIRSPLVVKTRFVVA